ncbi:MAG: hypothetical protein LBV50_01035 [Novosphingobium sp.]|jgi:hypothetical protein|nr:hypothetical protein [Novosphingobium sp.]
MRPGDDQAMLTGAPGTPQGRGWSRRLRQSAVALSLAFIVQSGPAGAGACAYGDVNRLGRDVARHFAAGTLGDPGRRLPPGLVRLRIEHSIDEGDDPAAGTGIYDGAIYLDARAPLTGIEAQLAAAQAEKEEETAPARAILGPMQCRGLVCDYGPSPTGILHNHLYLTRITAARSGKCLTLKQIDILDGD